MRELEPLRSRVDEVLAEFLGGRLEEATVGEAGGGEIDRDGHRRRADQEFVSSIADLITRGGKRLRASLCVLGWTGTGHEVDDAIVRGGASLELLHACALIHDDVMVQMLRMVASS